MSGTDLEHRSEIRRANRTTPIWIGLAIVTVAAVVLFGASDDDPDEEGGVTPPTSAPATPTSETLTTTSPRDLPPVFGVTGSGGHVRPISTRIGSGPTRGDPSPLRLGPSTPVVTAGRVVVLDEGGTLHHAEAGQSFRAGICCFEAIHPSNEPDHVWGRQGSRAGLIDLDAVADPRIVLDVGGDRILGPASFGLVTVDDGDVVRWHRPSFEPTVVPLPGDRRPIDAGGEHLLAVAPGEADATRLEVWSLVGDGLVQSFTLGTSPSAGAALAPDGSVVAVNGPGGWEVRDPLTGLVHGALPEVDRPVWVGGARFAAVLDQGLVVSDSGEWPLRWPLLAVAEQSP